MVHVAIEFCEAPMQLIKFLAQTGILLAFTNPTLASSPFQVLQTCMNGKPYNSKITMIEIEGEGQNENPLEGCEDQYDRIYQNKSFGTLTCQDKFYLVINDRKIDPALAENYSINPEIKPGTFFTPRAIWYKIDFENKEYVCIFAPLAEQGIGGAYNQYYIVNNAFDNTLTPQLNFYFFDKNIAPITSKTL
jgi:hypothetical protein